MRVVSNYRHMLPINMVVIMITIFSQLVMTLIALGWTGSHPPARSGGSVSIDTNVILIYRDTVRIQPQTDFDLPVIMTEGYTVSAISLSLLFPDDYMEIKGIDLASGIQGYSLNIEDSMLIIAWSSLNPLIIEDNEVLLTIHAKALDLTGLEETLKLELGGVNEFADDSAQVIENVILQVPEIYYPIPEDTLTSSYLKIYPNPIKDFLWLEFYLESDSRVEISLSGISGEMLEPIVAGYYSKGFKLLKLSDFPYSKGVYLLRFEADDGEKTFSRNIKILSIK